jgi:Uma2 family endonuclease
MRLLLWADQQGGWTVFESSAGFRLPDGSVLSPEQRRGFAPLCPDLVVELASPGAGSRPPRSRPAWSFPGCS